jgi:Chaperone of endosialidase
MTTLRLTESNHRSPFQRSTLNALALCCFALAPTPNAFGVVPPPDGGYPGANTAEGQSALFSLTTGVHNTALGFQALFRNTTGSTNTASGAQALLNNTTGFRNTAAGFSALFTNTTGFENTAIGLQALYRNTTGNTNTATGVRALHDNTTGSRNTASGYQALFGNGAGTSNTATGELALYGNITGNNNTAIGAVALVSNLVGNNNIALGYGAGSAITAGNFNIDIGNGGVFDESNTIRIGDSNQSTCFIAGIRGVTTINNNAIPVLIDSAGQLGTASSARRYKTDIKPIDTASESILALKPVSFRYKIHKDSARQFGLIAEDVAQVSPDLVIYEADGKPYTVRYDAVNAMLLNEFLKEHQKVQELEKQVEKLTAGLQKVSDQLELNKSTPQIVNSQ